jgi:redox-sensitive bicupin YhaK (pirin superfamily)
MITIRRAEDRGHADHGWLDTRHTFSFADYHDPEHMGFGPLRVLNDDRVRPRQGFGTHGHRDMEIISYVLEGELSHEDSMGNGSVIRPGEVQRMSAGTGVLHSEQNPSRAAPVHFLQIWIIPSQSGLAPSYEQKAYPEAERRGKLRLVASPDGRDGSVTIHQDARLLIGLLGQGERARHALAPGRSAWVHVARGAVSLDGQRLGAGDGAAVMDEAALELAGAGQEPAEVLVFDLPVEW